MEETVLIKERLQAITSKRKIQQDIASKRLEMDREKLKLQHLRKRSMRDLWLMSGSSPGEDQKVQSDAQQSKNLQSNIHRLQKEIEALEREELNVCRNEELILTRLRAVEKSNEDIIKAANENFKSEPVLVPPGTLLSSAHTARNAHDRPALVAMEINVQKDLRTGESRVLSACTVSAQELQQQGVKVYDDGRKSVYAVHPGPGLGPGTGRSWSGEVDELSPGEVEDLLKQARMRKENRQEQRGAPCSLNVRSAVCTASDWPELDYMDSDEQDRHAREFRSHRPARECFRVGGEVYDGETGPGPIAMNPGPPSPPALAGPRPSTSDQPVTMIFMGYRRAEGDAPGFEGSVQAELVVIGDGDEERPGPCGNHGAEGPPTVPQMDHTVSPNPATLLKGRTGQPQQLHLE